MEGRKEKRSAGGDKKKKWNLNAWWVKEIQVKATKTV